MPRALVIPVLAILPIVFFSPRAVAEPPGQPPQDGVLEIAPPQAVTYTPPPCAGLFPDVPCSHQFAEWIEQLYRDRITTGCGGGLFCPDSYVTRGQMAAFLERMARGTERWPPYSVIVHEVLNDDGSPNAVKSGDALKAAIDAIPDSGPMAPSASRVYVVFIGPGYFDLGTDSLTLPGFVYLQGAGQYATVITSNAGPHGTLKVFGETSLSDLYVIGQGQSQAFIYAVVAYTGLQRLLAFNCGIQATNATTTAMALYLGGGSRAVLKNAHVYASAAPNEWAIYTETGSGILIVEDSFIGASSGSKGAIKNQAPFSVLLHYNKVMGQLVNLSSGSYHCYSNVDWSTYETTKTCP